MRYLPTYMARYLPTYVTVVTVVTVVVFFFNEKSCITYLPTYCSSSSYSSDSSETNHKKKFLSSFFLSTFGQSNMTHLTTDVMFSGQRCVILAIFI